MVLAQKEKVNAVLGSWGSSLSMAGGPIFAEAIDSGRCRFRDQSGRDQG